MVEVSTSQANHNHTHVKFVSDIFIFKKHRRLKCIIYFNLFKKSTKQNNN
jgi:hypothetical protein